MHSTATDRRRFLGLLAAGAVGGFGLVGRVTVASAASATLLGQARPGLQADGDAYLAARRQNGRYEVAVFKDDGSVKRRIDLPDRGHSFAIDAARGRAVAFGRQPGFYAVAFGLSEGQQSLVPEKGRHFFGHGVFTPDGKLMAATENDYEAGQGVIGLYDAGGPQPSWRRVGEWPTYGVGPHEIVLMPDGRTACIANGGLLTHPDYGKLILNRDSMNSSLAYIDLHTGQLLEQVFLPEALRNLSIRHLALDGGGKVWFGCQYEGPRGHEPPLVGCHRRGEALVFADVGHVASGWRAMKGYVGSLACDESGRLVATTSPVGGVAMFWNACSLMQVGSVSLFDGCGVAPAPGGGFLISSGQGDLWRITSGESAPAGAQLLRAEPLLEDSNSSWDNHMRRVRSQMPDTV